MLHHVFYHRVHHGDRVIRRGLDNVAVVEITYPGAEMPRCHRTGTAKDLPGAPRHVMPGNGLSRSEIEFA